MTGGRGEVDRRGLLKALASIGLLAAVPGCAAPFADRRLSVATGSVQGVYFTLGTALSLAWTDRLGLTTPPEVVSTAGSVDNLDRLAAGTVDVAFSQVDIAAGRMAGFTAEDPRTPRALARIYDEFVHVVVPASSPITSLAGLRGARVSVGVPGSGYFGIAALLLAAAGLSADTDIRPEQLDLPRSVTALQEGRLDAFFWTGALPTPLISALAEGMGIRLLDLDDVIGPVQDANPVYSSGTVPAGRYGLPASVSTLLVRNFLLVRAEMAEDLAYVLVDTVFRAQEQLALASPSALTIDLRAAILTNPVPLHPGAQRYFRERETD